MGGYSALDIFILVLVVVKSQEKKFDGTILLMFCPSIFKVRDFVQGAFYFRGEIRRGESHLLLFDSF